MESMACELGECGHIDQCVPDPSREYRGWCPYCSRPVYSDQAHGQERRTNGASTRDVPVHVPCQLAEADDDLGAAFPEYAFIPR